MDTVEPTRAAKITDDASHLLLDVREDDEWEAGHAPRAHHVPLAQVAGADLPTDRPVVVVCRSGKRSAKAVETLTARGLGATNLTGGMTAWQEAGLEVITASGEPGTVV